MELPSIENLRCFVSAARHLNFRRAAEEVHLTPAAFGQRIQQLESQLGTTLFQRTTRRVELSAAGHRLLPEAKKTLQHAANCVVTVAPEARPVIRLTLGTRLELGGSWVVPAVVDWEHDRPDLSFDVYFGSGPDILNRLEKGLLDAVITSAAVARQDWRVEFLHQEEYVFVASPTLVAVNPFDHASDSLNHVLFDVDETLPLTRYLSSAAGASWNFKDVRLCGMGDAMRQMCLAARGCAVLPRYIVAEDLLQGTLIELFPGMKMLSDSFRLLFPQHSPFAQQLSEWAEYLRARPLT